MSLIASGRRQAAANADRAWLFFFVPLAAGLASRQRPDANWDFRNYHIYNGYAALTGRLGFDLAPAQMQTYLHPGLDVLSTLLRQALGAHPAMLNAVMAIPHGVAAFLAFRIALLFVPATLACRRLLAALAVVLGASGAAGLPVLGTTQSEMVPACFMLAGLFLVLRGAVPGGAQPGGARPAWQNSAWAGLLFGIGAGLKLTVAGYALGGVAVLLVAPASGWRERVAAAALFGGGVLGGLLVVAGPWWAVLYHTTGNPVFPYYNDFFRSPLVDARPFTDERFKPRDWMQALFYPFTWVRAPQILVSDVAMRDPRFAMAYAALAFMAIRAGFSRWARHDRAQGGESGAWLLGVFFAVSFAAWEKQFSIFRYLAPLELLCGVVVLLPLLVLLAAPRWRFVPHVVMTGLLAGSLVWTVSPHWGRGPRTGPAVQVTVPALEPDSLVVLLDGAPMAYVAAFAPASVRFVGANNNLIRPGQRTGLAQAVEAAIRDHVGPLWGLDVPGEGTQDADVTLRYHRLRRAGACSWIRSNIDGDGIRICRLRREAAG